MRYGPFRAILAAQARYLAPVVVLATILTALLPLLSLQGPSPDTPWHVDRVSFLLQESVYFGRFYPAVALALGALFAVANWLPDAAGRWVYAFTLPIPRHRLAALRLAAGGVLLLPALLSLWLVGVIGARVSDLPPVIQAHPGALALRFAAATAVVYAVGSLIVLLGRKVWFLAVAVVLLVVLNAFGFRISTAVLDALFLHPLSPFHALAGYWLYLDV